MNDDGFVETTPVEHGGTLYRRSPESLVVEQAADILEHVSTDELVSRIQEMREHLTEYRSEFGVESPEELAVDQTNQTLSESGSPEDEIDLETIREWKTPGPRARERCPLDRQCRAIRRHRPSLNRR